MGTGVLKITIPLPLSQRCFLQNLKRIGAVVINKNNKLLTYLITDHFGPAENP
jgi:hypothetical protein